MNALDHWVSFYVIAGTSAGTLIGLQFVALTLYANGPQRDTQPLELAGRAFSTPTVIHFGAVLLAAGILSAPWGAVTYHIFTVRPQLRAEQAAVQSEPVTTEAPLENP